MNLLNTNSSIEELWFLNRLKDLRGSMTFRYMWFKLNLHF